MKNKIKCMLFCAFFVFLGMVLMKLSLGYTVKTEPKESVSFDFVRLNTDFQLVHILDSLNQSTLGDGIWKIAALNKNKVQFNFSPITFEESLWNLFVIKSENVFYEPVCFDFFDKKYPIWIPCNEKQKKSMRSLCEDRFEGPYRDEDCFSK